MQNASLEWLSSINWLEIIYAAALFVIGFIVAKQVSAICERAVIKRFSKHQASLTRRLVFYTLFLLFTFSALQQLGFKLTVLLGAAGVFTVALSFASKTAASNLVSGIFLIFECPFKVGDSVTIKNISGTVDSIDLLSTKINTPDNIRVRIPNETVVQSEISNMSYFKTRRIDLIISASYDNNIAQVKEVLLDIAKNNPFALDEPEANVIVNTFADSAIEYKLMVWAKTKNVGKAKSELNDSIKKRFDEENIGMPYPQITIHQST